MTAPPSRLVQVVRRGQAASGAVVAPFTQAATSLGLQVIALRELGAEGFGVYALLISGVLLATALTSGLIGDPLTVLDRADPGVRRGIVLIGSATIAISGVAGILLSWLTDLVSPTLALLFGAAMVAFVVEDLMRRMLMAVLQFWRVVAIDGVVLVSMVSSILVIRATSGRLSLADLLVALLVAQTSGAIVGIALLPREERSLGGGPDVSISAPLRFGAWRAAQQSIRPAALMSIRVIVVVAVGTTLFGQLEAARVYTAPTMLVVNGAASYLLASYSAQTDRSISWLFGRADRAALVLAAAMAGMGLVALVLLPWCGGLIAGDEFDLDAIAVAGWIAYSGACAIVMPYVSLASVRADTRSWSDCASPKASARQPPWPPSCCSASTSRGSPSASPSAHSSRCSSCADVCSTAAIRRGQSRPDPKPPTRPRPLRRARQGRWSPPPRNLRRMVPPQTTAPAVVLDTSTRPESGVRGVIDRWWFAVCVLLLIVASDYEFRTRAPSAALAAGIDAAIVIEVALYALVAGFLAAALPRIGRRARPNPPLYLCGAFVGLLGLSLTYAPNVSYAGVRVAQMVVLLGLTMAAGAHATRDHFHRLAHGFIVLVSASVAFGLAVPSTPINRLQVGRFTWLAIHPTVSGLLVGLSVVFIAAYLVAGPRPSSDEDRSSTIAWSAHSYVALLVFNGVALLMTQTRGAIAGAVFGGLVILVTSRAGRAVIDLGIALLVLVGGLLLWAAGPIGTYLARGENRRTARHAQFADAAVGRGLGRHRAATHVGVRRGLGPGPVPRADRTRWRPQRADQRDGRARCCRSHLLDPAGRDARRGHPTASTAEDAGVAFDRAILLATVTFLLVDGFVHEGPGAVANVAVTFLFVAVAWLAVIQRTAIAPASATAPAFPPS